jgi:hypothetical protein
MSLDILPNIIIKNIIEFMVPDNKNTVSFISSCKTFYNIGKKFGYIKYLNTKNNTMINFIIKCCEHHNTLYTIVLEKISDPQLWIPMSWPKYVYISHCQYNEYIDPPVSNTEYLNITNIHLHNNKTLRINWKKFPKLKHIVLSLSSIDLTNIETCKYIENLFIELKNATPLYKGISKLHNLIYLNTNCILNEQTHFISKKLKTCNTGNKQLITKGTFNIFPLYTNLYIPNQSLQIK